VRTFLSSNSLLFVVVFARGAARIVDFPSLLHLCELTGIAGQNKTGKGIVYHFDRVCFFICLNVQMLLIVLRPGKGECADPVYEDAMLERVREGPPGQSKERQLAPDTGGGKT
jgi:hypothetical protein